MADEIQRHIEEDASRALSEEIEEEFIECLANIDGELAAEDRERLLDV